MMFYPQYIVTNVKNHSKQQTKRKKFTKQEDDLLKLLTREFGILNWTKISQFMPSRTAKQCRDRYCNYLSEVTKDEPWTKEEDDMILNLLQLLGPKWVEISHYIPGRSGINVKNRWYKHLKKYHLDLAFNIIQNEKINNKGSKVQLIENNTVNEEILKPNIIIEPENVDLTFKKYSISSLLI